MKIVVLRLVAFAALMLLYAWSPWVGVAALLATVWYLSRWRARRVARFDSHGSAAITVLIGGTLAGVVVTAQSPSMSIREHIRQNGVFERIVLVPYEQLAFRDLVGRADLIVEASTTGGRASLNHAETDIYTDYPFELYGVLKTSAASKAQIGDTVMVRRDSGVIVVEGRTALSEENDFPAFNPGERYVLFLNRSPDADAYQIYGGPQGAFTVVPEVRQLSSQQGDWNGTRGVVLPTAFFDKVRALVEAGTTTRR